MHSIKDLHISRFHKNISEITAFFKAYEKVRTQRKLVHLHFIHLVK